ncbi:MAG TPA: hypothetical protein VH144_00800 [Candidatus Saccharimonadales bacterium]|jgi:cytoskeletal protein RodZ|nr:hypothetical protein [Candidatus Saccharimonadales bacterium]
MAQQINTPTQPSRSRSTIIFVIIGLLLVGVASGGVWLAKQRSQQLATNAEKAQTADKGTDKGQTTPSQTERGQQTAPTTSNPPASGSSNAPSTAQPSTGSTNTATTPPATTPPAAQSAPTTGGNLPATGPDDVAFAVGALALGGVTYLALRSWQDRALSPTS